jgi:hypothetical protein
MSGIYGMQTGFRRNRPPAGFGNRMSVVTTTGAGGGMPAAPYINPASRQTFFPQQPQPFKWSDVIQHRVNPGFSRVADRDGSGYMPIEEAMNLGPLYHAGWDTSGVGPGTKGYRGSAGGGGNQGGGAERPQGGPAPLARTGADYIRERGGLSTPLPSLLNEGYLNQPGVTQGAFDRLQSQKAMDQADPVAALYANKSQTSTGPQAEFWQQMLQDQLARRTAEMGGGAWNAPAADAMAVDGATYEGGAPEYHVPGETRQDAQGNTWRWNEQQGRGELVRTSFADAYAMRPPPAQTSTFIPGENLGEGDLYSEFGTGSVEQGAPFGSQPSSASFTNGHGSSMAGVQFPGPRYGAQSAADFFSDRADFVGEANRFASPSPGYGGNPIRPNTPSWQAYSRAMEKKRLLGAR